MQNLLNSLTRSSSKLPDPPAIKAINRSNSSISSERGPYNFCRFSGNYTFFISPNLTSCGTPEKLSQSATLVITAYTDSSMRFAIACSCKWFRVINEKPQSLPINSNTFQLSAMEVGCILRCEVKSDEEDYKGVAVLTIGPVELEELLRCDLENILEAPQSKYFVRLVNEARDLVGKDRFLLVLQRETLKICSDATISQGKCLLELPFSVNLPEIEADYADCLKIVLVFRNFAEDSAGVFEKLRAFLSVKEQFPQQTLKLGLLFENRNIKDVFLMVFRCLAARKYLVTNKILEDFEKMVSVSANKLDLVLEVDKLKRKNLQFLQENRELLQKSSNISKTASISSNKDKEKDAVLEEKRFLQKKIHELETQVKELSKPNKLFQEFDMKQSFLSDCSILEEFVKETPQTSEKNEKIARNQDFLELKMMNDLLKMEVNTYKAQRESQLKELASCAEENKKLRSFYEEKLQFLRNSEQNCENSALFQENTRLKLELDRANRESIVQRGKLIEERDKLKEKLLKSQENDQKTEKKPNNFLENDAEKEKLRAELETLRKSSIVERGRLIEERNLLRKELEILRKPQNAADLESARRELKETREFLQQEREKVLKLEAAARRNCENSEFLSDFRRVSQENTAFCEKISERDQRIAKLLIEANENHEKLMRVGQELANFRSFAAESAEKLRISQEEAEILRKELKLQQSSQETAVFEAQSQIRRFIEEKATICAELALARSDLSRAAAETQEIRAKLEEKEAELEISQKNLVKLKVQLIEDAKTARQELETQRNNWENARNCLENATILLENRVKSLKEENLRENEAFEQKLRENAEKCAQLEQLLQVSEAKVQKKREKLRKSLAIIEEKTLISKEKDATLAEIARKFEETAEKLGEMERLKGEVRMNFLEKEAQIKKNFALRAELREKTEEFAAKMHEKEEIVANLSREYDKNVQILREKDEIIGKHADLCEEKERIVAENAAKCQDFENSLRVLVQEKKNFVREIEGLRSRLQENERISAENERISAENERIVAENAKIVAENDRNIAENAKILAENARISQENARISQENARILQENAEIIAENSRLVAEKAGFIEQISRLSQENQRIQAELSEKLSQKSKTHAEMINTKKTQIEWLEGSLSAKTAENLALCEELQETRKKLAEISAKHQETLAETAKISEKLAVSEKKLADSEQKLADSEQNLVKLSAKHQETLAETAQLSEKLAVCEQNLVKLSAKHQETLAETAKISGKLAVSEKKLAELSAKHQQELDAETAALSQKLSSESRFLAETQAQLREKSRFCDQAYEELEKMRVNLAETEEKADLREEELVAENQRLAAIVAENERIVAENLRLAAIVAENERIVAENQRLAAIVAENERIFAENQRLAAIVAENERIVAENQRLAAIVAENERIVAENQRLAAIVAEKEEFSRKLEAELLKQQEIAENLLKTQEKCEEKREKSEFLEFSKRQAELQAMVSNLTVSYERLLKENIRLVEENRENCEKLELLENDFAEVNEEKDRLLVEMSKLLNN